MKVALIYPRTDYNIDFVGNDGYVKNMSGYPPLSLAYVAAIIKRAGHDAVIIDGNIHNFNLNAVIGEIKKISPDLLGFSVTFPTFHPVLSWIKSIKEITGIPVIIGGSFTELYPSEFMRHKEIDYMLCGTGISTLPKFLNYFLSKEKEGFYDIPGLCFREGGKVIINDISSLEDDINDMPYPARELLSNDKYFSPFSEKKNFTPFIASKGCLYRCVYCCLSGKLQLRNADDIMEELEECYHRFKIRGIDFYDSIFTIDKDRVLEICRRIRAKKLKFRWFIRTHINFIDEELVKEMSAAGCRMIMYGIESTDGAILKNLKRPEVPLKKIKEIVCTTRKNGISAFGFFMFGCPGETELTIKSSISASRGLGLDFAQFTRITPIPGTELYKDYLCHYGYDYWRQVIIDNKPQQQLSCVNTSLESKVIVDYVRKGNAGFYFRPKQIIRILLSVRSYIQLSNYLRSGWNMLIFYFSGHLKKKVKPKPKAGFIILSILTYVLLFNVAQGYGESEARVYFRQGKYEEAIRICKKEIEKNPDNYEPYYDLGGVYNILGKYDEALKYYKVALKINPSNSDIYSDIGNNYGDMGKHKEAAGWYRKAIELNPKRSDYYTYLGEVYENFGRYQDAIKWYNKAIEVDNSQTDSYYDIGRMYDNMGNYKEAIKWHKKAISINPKNTKAYYGLGAVYENQGRYDEAVKLYKEAIRINPDEFRSYFGLGNISRKQYKYNEAKKWYEESIKKSPSQRFILCPYEGLGLVYAKLGRTQETEETFLSMVKLKPCNPLGYSNLSRYYFEIGKLALARQNIDKALSLIADPADKRQALQLKGFILIMQQDYAQAEKLFNGLVKEYGNDRVTLAGLGHIAFARKRNQSARKYFEDALKQPDAVSVDTSTINDRAIILLGLGWVNADEHKYKEAITCYEKILKEEPITVFALIGMGNVYTELGEYAKAEVYFKRASAINPEFPGKPSKESLKESEAKR